MNINERLQDIQRLAWAYGERRQQIKMIEEASELFVAITHLQKELAADNAEKAKEWRANYIEELADTVIIATQLLSLLSDEEKEKIEEIYAFKIDRELQRIGAYKDA